MTRDRYDQEVDRVTDALQHGKDIYDFWAFTSQHSLLFDCCSVERSSNCGCLTQVRSGTRQAETQAITDAILTDVRLPVTWSHVTIAKLPVFAEWQRRIDTELGREVPPLLPE